MCSRQLDSLTDFMRANRESRAFQEAAWQYRQTINEEYAGPRLLAEIRASQSFIPRSFWVTYMNNHDEMLPFYEAETTAIQRRDPDGARAACAGRAEAMGRIMVAELVRRGVFSPSGLATAAVGCVLNELKPPPTPPRRLRCFNDPFTGRIARAFVVALVGLLVFSAADGRHRLPPTSTSARRRASTAPAPLPTNLAAAAAGPRRGQVHDARPSSRSTPSTSTRWAWARPAC